MKADGMGAIDTAEMLIRVQGEHHHQTQASTTLISTLTCLFRRKEQLLSKVMAKTFTVTS